MNIRDAILKAADSIERNPSVFDFYKTHIPECGSPGCAVGLVACHAGVSSHSDVHRICDSLLGVPWYTFYNRLSELSPGWQSDAHGCIAALRLYADKYHPAEKAPRNFARELMASLPAERIPDEVAR